MIRRPRLPRPRMVMLPNGMTLANLFAGMFSIVAASRGDYGKAVGAILIGGLFDAFDGRIARATGTGSRFGEELDSLVDAISFGLAPALLMYFAVLNKTGWDWVFAFLYTSCAVMRLARFNIEQAGRAKEYFRGLPSPAAGIVLASYYWFSQTPLFNYTIIANWPWTNMVRVLLVVLGFLMISNVPYLAWPTFGGKTAGGIFGLIAFLFAAVVGTGVGLWLLGKEFIFPVGLTYVLGSVVIAVVRGFTDRRPIFRGRNAIAPVADYGDELDQFDDDDDDVSPYLDDDDIEYDAPPARPITPAAQRPHRPAPQVQQRPAHSPRQPQQQVRSPQPPRAQAPSAADGNDEGSPFSQAPSDGQRKRRRRRRSRGGRGGSGGGASPDGGSAPTDNASESHDHDSHQDSAE